MAIHLQREMDKLETQLLDICAAVEQSVALAVRAIEEQDERLATQVVEGDVLIDRTEVEIEEECLKIMALHQPVAVDLRVLVAVLKINNDLERIGDLAVNIAERALFLASHDAPTDRFEFQLMADKVKRMLRQGLDAFVNMDVALAYRVCADDDEVDAANRKNYQLVEELAAAGKGGKVGPLMHLLSVSRNLERIADHATNIAEDVIYMIDGEIVRHRIEDHTEG